MSKSIGAKILSNLLQFWPKQTPEETEAKLAEVLQGGEKPTPPPKNIVTRYEDNANGRMFYINEKGESRYIVFYIHGGAYRHDFIAPHWLFIEKLVKETNALVIAPGYRLVPFATYREAFDLILPVYRETCETHPDKKIIVMGDSAGGGFSVALAEHCKANGLRLPDELVLMSPWVDAVMDSEEIAEYQARDPFLCADSLRVVARHWAGDLDARDWRISPINGDVKGLHHVTVFVGTCEVFYPDILRFFNRLDKDGSNELIVGEEMNHVYPLFPIPEAASADNKIFHAVMR